MGALANFERCHRRIPWSWRSPPNVQKPGGRVILLEQLQDSIFKIGRDDAFTLVDVTIYQRLVNSRITTRRVIWARARLKREQLIAFLRLERICEDQEHNECTVFINNALWHHGDQAVRHLRSGDYINAEVFTDQPTTEETMSLLRVQETCDRHRRIFTSTPSSDTGQGSSGDERSGGRRHLGSRSRSRDRGLSEAPGNAEEAPWDLTSPNDRALFGIGFPGSGSAGVHVWSPCVESALIFYP